MAPRPAHLELQQGRTVRLGLIYEACVAAKFANGYLLISVQLYSTRRGSTTLTPSALLLNNKEIYHILTSS